MPLMPSMVMPNYPSALAVALFYHAAGLVGLVLALVVLGLWLLRRGSPAGEPPAFHPARLQVPAREGLVATVVVKGVHPAPVDESSPQWRWR